MSISSIVIDFVLCVTCNGTNGKKGQLYNNNNNILEFRANFNQV